MKVVATVSIAAGLAMIALPLHAFAQNSETGMRNADLIVEASPSTGAYTITRLGQPSDSLTAGVAAKANSAWLRSSDYPRHEISRASFNAGGVSEQDLVIANSGLSGAPDLIATLSVFTPSSPSQIKVEVRNSTGKEISIQAIRVLDAHDDSFLNLNGPDSADRVLSDSFSEDRPDMLIHDLTDAENSMHRAVGSQLVYNRQSHQSLFVGALGADRWLTVLRLHLDPSKSKISAYEVESTGTTELTSENSLLDSPPEDRIELSLPVAPGATLASEPVMLALGSDYHAQLEAYGAAIRARHSARVTAPTPIGWWSWTAYYFGLTEGAALTNAEWLSAHLRDLGYKFFHIDEGYQFARGEYATPDAVMIPHGMQSLESKVRALGLTPGIWTAPFEVSERSWVFANHKDWLVHNAGGQPIHTGFVTGHTDQLYALDATNPGAQDYLRQTYRTLTRDWGIRYIKLDFMEDSAVEGARFRANTTALQALRIGLEIIRGAVGEDVLLDKDGSPMLTPVGIVDAGRISSDTGHTFDDTRDSATGIAARYFMNRNYFIADPDAFNVSNQTMAKKDRPLTDDEARASIALAAASGGMFEIGDDLPTLGADPDRLALVENRDLINIARWGRASTPLDLMTYPLEQGRPSVFVLPEGPGRAIVTIFNWSDKPFSRNFAPQSGEDFATALRRQFDLPAGDYEISDLLDPSRRSPFDAIHTTLTQPPHSALMIKFVDRTQTPPAPKVEFDGPASTHLGEPVRFYVRSDVGENAIRTGASTDPNITLAPALATSDGVPVVAFHWDFGDGTSADGIAAAHTYTHSCKCAVTLTVELIDDRSIQSVHRIDASGSFDTQFTPSRNRRFSPDSQIHPD
jgi:hypothetical protein